MSGNGDAVAPPVLRDRDIFQDYEGRVFVTLGYIQPEDRVLSFLKYTKHPEGKWRSGGLRYTRVFWGGVESVVDGLSLLPSQYIAFDSHFRTELVEPPRSMLSKYYRPETRLRGIIENGPADGLEAYVERAGIALNRTLGIPLEKLGVAGSILWGAHNPDYSDVNMNIYGLQDSHRLLKAYDQLAISHDDIRLREPSDWRRAMERVRSRIPVLTQVDLERLFKRRKAICIENRCIGITPVLLPEEAPIRHGTERYEATLNESVLVRATVTDSTYGQFTPSLYEVDSEPTSILGGDRIERVLVYDGAFSGLFDEGDHVEISGVPQTVLSQAGQVTCNQIMVGTKTGSGKEYIRFLD